ncbi:MAG: class I SAM-dependent methyltransferase [Streptosporangiaceae bacterium]|nr:class I SAM-dependent methyltransferase [Streptosporangiaceae bacterium]
MGSAVLRAAHMQEDAPPWVLEDRLSERLLDRRSLGEVRAEIARWAPEVRAAFRLAHAVRSRLAEDIAMEGLAVGRHDYVLLGAGLDTFAWRHPRAGLFRIWEIDHPATQRWKRRALAERQLGEPANVRFVPVDLAALSLGAIDTPVAATWNWLGVTMYLERPVTEQVLQVIAQRDIGTTLVVNFLLADEETDDFTRAFQATAAEVVSREGEPVRAAYTRSGCVDLLARAGFSSISLFDAVALKERYFPHRDDLRLPDSTLVCLARV